MPICITASLPDKITDLSLYITNFIIKNEKRSKADSGK